MSPHIRLFGSIRFVAVVASLLLVFAAPAVAQDTVTPPPPPVQTAPAAPPETALVVINQLPIIVFRAPLRSFSASDRALLAEGRIREFVESRSDSTAVIQRKPDGFDIVAAGRTLFEIVPGDADSASGETLEVISARAVTQIGAAQDVARQSLTGLLRNSAVVGVASLLFLIVVFLLNRLRRYIVGKMPRESRTDLSVSLAGFTLISTEHLLLSLRRIVSAVMWFGGLFVAYLWLAFVLTRFEYTRPFGERLGNYLAQQLLTIGSAIVGALPNIILAVLIFVSARWLAKLAAAFFEAVENGSVNLRWVHSDTAGPTKRIVVALIWIFGLILAYPMIPGSDSKVFQAVSVFAGLVISLGSSGVVNQAMSGLVLMYSRALRVGDYVMVGDVEGVVMDVSLLSTKVRSNKREAVTLPSAVVVGSAVKNFSRLSTADGLLMSTTVTAGYSTPWRQAEALLMDAAHKTIGLSRQPPPFVLKSALADFYVEYQLHAVLQRPEDRIYVLDKLNGHILDNFNEHGVSMLSPHYDSDPAQPVMVPKDQWYQAPARRPAGEPR